jgi:uncharacterized membrane protein YedE/YeeE
MKTLFLVFIAGVLFGAGLALSGMTDPTRVIDFLDITGNWDPTLAFVMGGAILVFGGGRWAARCCCDVPTFGSDPVSKNIVIGSAIFGVGWGLGGFCPGPALADLGDLRTEALVFVPTMAIGMFIAQRIFKVDQ